MREFSKEVLESIFQGNVSEIELLPVNDVKLIERIYGAIDHPAINKDTVIHVLQSLKSKPDESMKIAVQKWSEFMRWGIPSGSTERKIKPIEINIAFTDEDKIIDILAQLDELNDDLDGGLSNDEIDSLILSLR